METNWRYTHFHLHPVHCFHFHISVTFSLLLFFPQLCLITSSSLLSMTFNRQQFLSHWQPILVDVLSEDVRIHKRGDPWLSSWFSWQVWVNGFQREATQTIVFWGVPLNVYWKPHQWPVAGKSHTFIWLLGQSISMHPSTLP